MDVENGLIKAMGDQQADYLEMHDLAQHRMNLKVNYSDNTKTKINDAIHRTDAIDLDARVKHMNDV